MDYAGRFDVLIAKERILTFVKSTKNEKFNNWKTRDVFIDNSLENGKIILHINIEFITFEANDLPKWFFTVQKNNAIEDFANTWFVERCTSFILIQYVIGMNPIPNIGDIINSKDFDKYKFVYPDAKPFRYGLELVRHGGRCWKKRLFLCGMG